MTFPYYQQNYQQYFPQNYQPQGQPSQPTGIIWISGMQEASMYPVAPNNAVALWEQSGKTIYLKQADATGKPTIKVFDLVERTEAPHEEKPDYATKDDIKSVLAELEQMKSDLYSNRRKKVTDNDE